MLFQWRFEIEQVKVIKMKRYQEKKEGADYNKQPNLRRAMAIVAFSSFSFYASFLSLNDQYQENKM